MLPTEAAARVGPPGRAGRVGPARLQREPCRRSSSEWGERALGGTIFGLILAGVVLLVLLVTRRVGRKSYVPFGPFLIIGALWAVLIRA